MEVHLGDNIAKGFCLYRENEMILLEIANGEEEEEVVPLTVSTTLL